MQLIQLNYFLSVVEHGSFSAAARSVNIAQPAFSRHIRALEDDLGVALFERSVKGAELTAAGRRLRDRASSILRRVDHVRTEVRAWGDLPTGEVKIAFAASMAPLLSGEVYWNVRQKYPQIDLEIVDLNRVMSGHLLKTGQIDFALLSNAEKMSGTSTQPVFAQTNYLIGKSFPEHDSDTIRLVDLIDYPLVMEGKTHHHRLELEQAAGRLGHKLNIVSEQDSIPVIRSLMLSGPVYTIVPYSTFAEEIRDRLLLAREVVEPRLTRILSLTWKEEAEPSLAAVAVKEILLDALEEFVRKGELQGRVLVRRQNETRGSGDRVTPRDRSIAESVPE